MRKYGNGINQTHAQPGDEEQIKRERGIIVLVSGMQLPDRLFDFRKREIKKAEEGK